MKIWSILILIAIAFSITAPAHFVISGVPDKGKAVIFALDVCDKAGQPLSPNADIFSIHEVSCKLVPLEFSGFYKASNPAFNSFFVISQKKQPPKV